MEYFMIKGLSWTTRPWCWQLGFKAGNKAISSRFLVGTWTLRLISGASGHRGCVLGLRFEPLRWSLNLKAEIWAGILYMKLKLGLEAWIWSWRLGFESRGWDLSFEAGVLALKEEGGCAEEKEEKKRSNFPCVNFVKAWVNEGPLPKKRPSWCLLLRTRCRSV